MKHAAFNNIDNPFLLAGYVSSEYFCDRTAETAEMVEAIGNGRNLTLLSPRRMGKTGLIHHVFHSLGKQGVWTPIYIDVFATRNLAEFVKRFALSVVGSMDSRLDKALAAASAFFKSFRPVAAIDPVTGSPSLSFSLEPAQAEATLKECFDYLAAAKRRAVIAIDELPGGSVRLLKAIASSGRVREPTSAAFMAANKLRASASVRLSLAKLIGLGLVSREDDGSYVVDDRLFGIWLTSLT